MKYKTVIILLVLIWQMMAIAGETPYSRNNQLNINTANLTEIEQLPVNPVIAKRLYDHVLYRGYFKSIYDLRQVQGVNQALFETIKPLIRIEPFSPMTPVQEKIEQIYFRLDRWSSNEGVNDAFVDLWIEKALDPMSVNTARYDQLINLQNVSPVDAVAILNHRKDVHWFRDQRDLRRTPGLSNYAYRTARYFLDYQDTETQGWHGNVLMRMNNTPFMAAQADQTNQAGLSAVSGDIRTGYTMLPNMYYKTRLSYGGHFKFGMSYTRNLSEPNHYLNDSGIRIPDIKYYLGLHDYKWGDFNLRNLLVGNYKLTFGQGVVMENTDFYTPRKSGYGFRKRFTGISGDNSRTREFTLKGIAAEADFHNFSAIGFFSLDARDAIMNRTPFGPDSLQSFNQFIVLNQRFEYALDDSIRGPNRLGISWLNTVNEMTYGGHLQYDFIPGTFLGMSFYESLYDHPLDPNPYEIVGRDYRGQENWDRRQVTADSEIKQAYGGEISRGHSSLWSKAESFRRVYGLDFQTVLGNMVLQGEYGQLDKGGFSKNPGALVLSAYWQFPTLNILALYRNYDLGFDNPYQRSFSNYHRYKGSIYEDYYYLQSALYGQLYENSPQSQAEEGFYLSTFYQLSRKITSRFEYDNWLRKSDAAKHYRLVGTIDYHPVYPLTFQFRQKWQAREEQNSLTKNMYYKNLEFRGRMRLRLSNYDSFDMMYASSKLVVHPRPRVFGDIVLSGDALIATYIHNFNKNLKLSGMLAYYQGFLWNFEDTQFVVMDSRRGAIRYWLSMYARLDHHLSLRMKYTAEYQKPVSNVNFSPSAATQESNPDKRYNALWIHNSGNMFFVELNYNF